MAQNLSRQPFVSVMEPLAVLELAISKLDRLEIDYMLAGSFASSLYGLARFTQDADLVLDLEAEQIEKFAEAFAPEFYLDQEQIERAVEDRSVFNIIHLQSAFKVDFFILGKREFSRQEFSRRRLEQVDPASGLKAHVLTPEDTLLSKLDWYLRRGKVSQNQWWDVGGILRRQSDRLDFDYVRKWAAELGLNEALNQVFNEVGITGR